MSRLLLTLLLLWAWSAPPARAQFGSTIELDGSLGPAGPIERDGGTFEVGEAQGTRDARNLFHSFSTFWLNFPTHEVLFSAAAPTDRIIARVTGDAARVFGTLRSDVAGVDLYLISPAGIVTGPRFSADLAGSLTLSTADRLLFDDGLAWPAGEALAGTSAAAPRAWGFAGGASGSILLRPDDLSGLDRLWLVGSDVEVSGGRVDVDRLDVIAAGAGTEVPLDAASLDVNAPGAAGLGSVRLGSSMQAAPEATLLIEAGHIVLRGGSIEIDSELVPDDPSARSVGLSVRPGRGPGSGGLDLAARGAVRVSGWSGLLSQTADAADAGEIRIRADQLEVLEHAVIETASRGVPGEMPPGRGGDVDIGVRELIVRGTGETTSAAIRAVTTAPSGGGVRGGRGGDVRVEAESVTLERAGQISASTQLEGGDGGSIRIRGGTLQIAGGETDPATSTGIFARSGPDLDSAGPGAGGAILLEVDRLELLDGAEISARSFGAGSAGDIDIDAGSVRLAGGASGAAALSARTADGNGGRIRIATGLLEVHDGAEISATTFGAGDSGDIDIEAGALRVAGRLPTAAASAAGIFARASNPAVADPGSGGSIVLRAGELSFDAHARVSVATLSAAAAGDIEIDAGDVRLGGGASVESSSSLLPGAAGDIELRAAGRVEIGGGASLRSSTSGAGAGGSIRVTAGDGIRLEDGASVRAESTGDGAVAGDAGSVRLAAGRRVQLAGGARVTTEARAALGGNIAIEASERVYLRDSEISTSVASGAGSGGNIDVDPEFVVLDRSLLLARADAGSGGDITIAAREFVRSADSTLSASSRLGIDGRIRVTSPAVDLSADLASLPGEPLDASELLRERCALRDGARAASLSLRLRNAIPAGPDDLPFPPLPGTLPASRPRGEHEAVAHGRALVERGDGGPAARLELARALERAGDLNAARERARELHAASDETWLRAGAARIEARVALRSGRPGTSLEIAEAALRGSPGPGVRAALELERAAALDALGRGGEAADARVAAGRSASAAGASVLGAVIAIAHTRAALDAGAADASALAQLQRASAVLRAAAPDADTRAALLHLGRQLERIDSEASRLAAAALHAHVAQRADLAGDLHAAAHAWGHLGALYERAGPEHAADARRATREALRAALAGGSPEVLLLREWQMARLLASAGDVTAALNHYRAAVDSLQRVRRAAVLADANYAQLGTRLDAQALLTESVDLMLREAARTEDPSLRRARLAEVRALLADLSATEMQDYFQDECLAALRRPAPDEIPGALVVQPVVLGDRIELLVHGPGGAHLAVSRVDRERVTETVRRFRTGLQSPVRKLYRHQARQLYDWIVRPIERELREARPEVIVFVASGPLRGLPFGALEDRDGSELLIQRYPTVVSPGLSLIEPRPLAPGGLEMLRAGLTRPVAGMDALPGVAAELAELESWFPGDTLLDEAFGPAALRERLGARPFDVLHLATHAQLGATARESVIWTHQGSLRMADLADLVRTTRLRDRPLELLTLSACETARGDERAALGLAGIAVKAGARSTLATLWKVNDDSSSRLVRSFYRHLQSPGTSRARALQQAQLELIDARGGATRHAYHWSGFVLIGSWL